MITRSAPLEHTSTTVPTWQQELATAISDPLELFEILQLDPDSLPAAQQASRLFRLRVPRSYVGRMQIDNPEDPLLKQVLPVSAENNLVPGFTADPVGDLDAMVIPGLLHKYHGRVLLITTGACAVHCRYCFRRQFPYQDANAASEAWQPALNYIAADKSLREVILSGGDPLTLSDQRLQRLINELERIPHIDTLRIHTRLPIVLPSRVNSHLLDWLRGCRLNTVIVLHSNHANEMDTDVIQALAELKSTGATLLNQAVLLKDINDTVQAQTNLHRTLFNAGVLPYYLHLLDKVDGAAHFQVSQERARAIMQALSHQLPGYLMPRLVEEQAGAASKTAIL